MISNQDSGTTITDRLVVRGSQAVVNASVGRSAGEGRMSEAEVQQQGRQFGETSALLRVKTFRQGKSCDHHWPTSLRIPRVS